MTQVPSNETHFSAQQIEARPHPRFPRADGHQSRATGPEAPSRQGPREADAVTVAAQDESTGNDPGLTTNIRFSRDNRLLDAAAFGRVFKKASRSRDKFFTVLCRQNNEDVARLGLAISRKHCRRATTRNRVKRLIRESFRQQQALLRGLDIVVVSQPAAASASNRQVVESLEVHWQRCNKAGTAGT